MILDIFAQNARTPEGRSQVELALLRYRLPRLRGRGRSLSQQAGGIGTRGPGETILEVDRRRLLQRMGRLEAELRRLDRTRRTQRRSRNRSRHRSVSLVGYTNAGKSTLLNRLCGADVLVENRLFSTLDPRTRQLELAGGETVLDDRHRRVRPQAARTRWSRRSAPRSRWSASRTSCSTWSTAPRPTSKARSTPCAAVLAEIDAADGPRADGGQQGRRPRVGARMRRRGARSCWRHTRARCWCRRRPARGSKRCSSPSGTGSGSGDRVVELLVPWARGDVLAALHREGGIVGEVAGEEATRLQVVLDDVGRSRFAEFVAS